MKIKDACRALARTFRAASFDTPELDARVLMAALVKKEPAHVLLSNEELTPAQELQLEDWRARRLAYEPVARITGHRGFWKLELELSPATLEPRPDSETLIEAAIEHLSARRDDEIRIADLGTGTGVLLLALLQEFTSASGIGVDLSEEAVQTATNNAQKNNLAARAQFVRGNWFDALHEKFDLIVSNPPYISTGDCQALAPDVRLYDPLLALDGGPDGLAAYRELALRTAEFLQENGLFLVEVGQGQADAVTALFTTSGLAFSGKKTDLSGIIRALLFRRRQDQKAAGADR